MLLTQVYLITECFFLIRQAKRDKAANVMIKRIVSNYNKCKKKVISVPCSAIQHLLLLFFIIIFLTVSSSSSSESFSSSSSFLLILLLPFLLRLFYQLDSKKFHDHQDIIKLTDTVSILGCNSPFH